MPRRLLVLFCALGLLLATPAAAQAERCNAIEVETRGGAVHAVREYAPIFAITHPRRFGANAALWASVRGIGCDAFRDLMTRVLPVADEAAALDAYGWRIVRVDPLAVDGVRLHQVWARLGRQRVIYVRRGARVRMDAQVWRPGQLLEFPRTPHYCTAGFILHLPAPSNLYLGSTAGHCSEVGTPPGGGPSETETPNRIRKRPGKDLRDPANAVLTNANLREDTPDALVYSLHGLGWASQQIARPGGRPLRVVGMLPRERQAKGRTVCFSGVVSGSVRCGPIKGPSDFIGKPAICAGVRSRHGDSGGPVYTRPNRRGEVLAVGLLARSSIGGRLRDMCFVPIQDVLATFGAELPLGSFQP